MAHQEPIYLMYYIYKTSPRRLLIRFRIGLDIAYVFETLFHRVWVKVGCICGDAVLVLALVVGNGSPARGFGWVLDVFGHGELEFSQYCFGRMTGKGFLT